MNDVAGPVQVRLDSRQVQVLAHPLRARLLSTLRFTGPATATRLAEVLGTNTGATSYHLRQLAEIGLVVEDDRPARGRERWWRSAHDVSSFWRADFAGDADATAAFDWLNTYAIGQFVAHADAWSRAAPDEPAEWTDAAGLSDYLLSVNPDQLRALVLDLHDVVERHRAAATPPAPDARPVMFYLYGAPRVAPA